MDPLGFTTELDVRNFVPVLSTNEIYACPITASDGTRTPSPTSDNPENPSPVSDEPTLSADEAEVRARVNVSLEHLMTHLPCEPGCVHCTRVKAIREPARRVDPDVREQEMYDHDASTSVTGYGATT